MTARTPDHAAIFAAASLLAIPPLPRARPGAAGDGLERGVDLGDLLDQRRLGVETRVGGEQPGGVGEHHEQVGADQVRRRARRGGRCRRSGSRRRRSCRSRSRPGSRRGRGAGAASRARGGTAPRCTKSYGVSSTWPATSPCSDRIPPIRSMSSGWPTAATACSVPMSVGRLGEPERGHARRRSRPSTRARLVAGRARVAASSPHELEDARRRRARRAPRVIDDVPTFTTATHGPRSSRALDVLELDRRRSRTMSPSRAPARASARSTPMRRNRSCTYATASSFVRSAIATTRSADRPVTRHAPSSSRTTEKPCSSGRSTTNGSGSGSAARASSTIAPSRPSELVEARRA